MAPLSEIDVDRAGASAAAAAAVHHHQTSRDSGQFTNTKGLLNGPGQNNCFLNSAVQVCVIEYKLERLQLVSLTSRFLS